MNNFYCTILILLVSSQYIAAQLPDLKNFYNGIHNFNCLYSENTDTNDTAYGKNEYVYNTDQLPDSVILYDFESADSLIGIISFVYYPSDLYFSVKYETFSTWDTTMTINNMHYNQDGQITRDSCFYPDVSQLYSTTLYYYIPDGKVSQVIKDFGKNDNARLIWADTTQWSYNAQGQIDSIRDVYYFADELMTKNTYYPVYNNDSMIEKTLVKAWDIDV